MLSMIWKATLHCCKQHIYVNIWCTFGLKKSCSQDSIMAVKEHDSLRLLKITFTMTKCSCNTVKVTYIWNEVQTHIFVISWNVAKFTNIHICLACQSYHYLLQCYQCLSFPWLLLNVLNDTILTLSQTNAEHDGMANNYSTNIYIYR
jgi:hypothetical protein